MKIKMRPKEKLLTIVNDRGKEIERIEYNDSAILRLSYEHKDKKLSRVNAEIKFHCQTNGNIFFVNCVRYPKNEDMFLARDNQISSYSITNGEPLFNVSSTTQPVCKRTTINPKTNLPVK